MLPTSVPRPERLDGLGLEALQPWTKVLLASPSGTRKPIRPLERVMTPIIIPRCVPGASPHDKRPWQIKDHSQTGNNPDTSVDGGWPREANELASVKI